MKTLLKDGVHLTTGGYLTSELKQSALLALADGISPAKVSKATGIHIASIQRWKKEADNA